MKPIPVSVLHHAANAAVLRYLKDLSAHSDVVEALGNAVRPLGAVQLCCPDPASYRYVVACTLQTIFAFAVGQSEVGFRLEPPFEERALATGATAQPVCGPGWVCFTLFRNDWPAPDLAFWARKAYVSARESA